MSTTTTEPTFPGYGVRWDVSAGSCWIIFDLSTGRIVPGNRYISGALAEYFCAEMNAKAGL
jgi:hypothetical protein